MTFRDASRQLCLRREFSPNLSRIEYIDSETLRRRNTWLADFLDNRRIAIRAANRRARRRIGLNFKNA